MLHLWIRKDVRVKAKWFQLKPAVRMLHGPASPWGLGSWELRRSPGQVKTGQDRALPARAQSSCAQARRARDTQMSWSGSASILFLALWMIFIIPYIEMRNIAFLMFLSHKYNCYSHHKHTICPGRRVNDPCNNQVDHCHFLKVRKKRKFKTMEKRGNPQCCYFLLLYFLLLLLNDMQKV